MLGGMEASSAKVDPPTINSQISGLKLQPNMPQVTVSLYAIQYLMQD